MKQLTITNSQGNNVTTSLLVAEIFGKSHDKVLRDIDKLSCSQEFRIANFGESSYVTKQGKTQRMVEITKDGFSFLVMGYNGKEAGMYKEQFIKAFNQVVDLASFVITERWTGHYTSL